MMRVLLAHDGSDGAAKAVALARSIAWPKGSILRVVSVIEPIVMPLPGPWAADSTASSTLDEESTANVRELDAQAVRDLRARGDRSRAPSCAADRRP